MKPKCKALTKKGEPCNSDALLDGYCMRHFSLAYDVASVPRPPTELKESKPIEIKQGKGKEDE